MFAALGGGPLPPRAGAFAVIEINQHLPEPPPGALAAERRRLHSVKAYCIVYEMIDDPTTFEEYRRQVMPTITAHGGRFLVRGGAFTALEGDMPYQRIAMLEFPSRAVAETWYHSPEYQRILPLRTRSGRHLFVLVDGLET